MNNAEYKKILDSLLDIIILEKTKEKKLEKVTEIIFNSVENVIWAGFYLIDENDDLILGPFVGQSTCEKIEVGSGICGSAVLLGETKKVYDVSKFKGRIPCDEKGKSKLAVPIIKNDVVLGVISLDSDIIGNFTTDDEEYINGIIDILVNSMDWK